nr:hypothetical protein [Tanacetum cinerariifolium]
MVPFIKDLGYTRKCDMLSEIHTDQMHQPWRTFVVVINRKFKKIASSSEKQTLVLEEEPTKKPKQLSILNLRTTLHLLRKMFLQKSLQENSQLVYKSETLLVCNGVGSQPKVPDELQDKTIDTNEGTDKYVRTPSTYESIDDETEHVDEEEYDRIDDELYKDVNVKLKDVEHGEERKGDAEMTDAGHDDVTQETTYDQVKDDAHVILTTAHVSPKTEVPLQSSSVSSDFAT